MVSDLKRDKNFIGAYFSKQFHEELSDDVKEYLSPDEKRSNLERLYQYAKANSMPKSL
eukprot:CAMPEP_0170567674 /NCGR_PEP_ID=MMETSP0211-20121228/80632_1 /TAXON_ID=311385 /ORGANISM="Pseudokeronopsis sp., Strain OXSARD2" /LENGTH=57 /DNA_ID=CAMNT_0010889197 /DNA_START=741 /DNA_END=914 /DNA_ORIENTATION=+